MTTCAVIGLGKLGSSLAAVLGAGGVPVTGVDLDSRIVDAIASGRAPFPEPDLQAMIDRAGDRLRATTDVAEAVAASDLCFVVVPTPSDDSGRFTNTYVVNAVTAIGEALAGHDRPYTVAITSTVMPGSTSAEIAPALERASGRVVGRDVGLCYNPTFIALGTVVRDLTFPDLVLIGESDERSGALVEDVQRRATQSTPAIRRMGWVNAEVAKIAVNTFVTTKISFANMLAEVCENLPGGDVAEVTAAVGEDRRIGHAYLKGATAYGGPCFPRDNVALACVARDVGADAAIAEATDSVNRRQAARLAAIVERESPPGASVAILGLAYKPNTPVIEESPGLALADQLLVSGRRVIGFDPGVDPTLVTGHAGLEVVDSLAKACIADVAVVMTPCPEFEKVPDLLADTGVVVDCWNLVPEGSGVRVVRPGKAASSVDASAEAEFAR